MRRTLLLLLASMAFASLMSLADGAALKVMSAPNLLRVGTPEKIFVECQDCPNKNITVTINVMNHPTKAKKLDSTTVTLSKEKNFQMFGNIMIPAAEFNRNPTMKQYVYLQADFEGTVLEKVVLVSFQSGHIFIQTDKTIYTPKTKVLYRMFAVTPQMEPMERDEQNKADTSIAIEFVTPDDIIFSVGQVSPTSGVYSGEYQLPELVSTGLWKVVAKFQSNPQQSYSAEFEVKEYVLPSFEVKLSTVDNFFYVDSAELVIDIKATYLFGAEVVGTAYVLFGVFRNGEKQSFPSSLQRISVQRGEGKVTLKKEHIIKKFPNIQDLLGDSIFVSVSVLTDSGSEMVEAELRGIQIVTSPYTIHFKKTPKYFKPGMSFDVSVEVQKPDESPASGITVVLTPGEVKGITGTNGMARLTINTAGTDQALNIVAKTDVKTITPERQASASMTAVPYSTPTSNYIHIGVDADDWKLNDNLKINLNLNKQQDEEKDITYLILSRGQLVDYGRYRLRSQALVSLIIPISKKMLPSFRIVAYYHPNDNEVVSDSVWVDVQDSCMGSLTLAPNKASPSYQPRKTFVLKVTGDPEATVGLVAVDKGVYVLNNKHRLTQKKIWDIVEKSDTGCTPGGGKDSMGVFYDAGLLFVTDNIPGTPYRQDKKCPVPSARRRKRATTIIDVTTTLIGKYKDNKLQSECCLDGMKDTPVSYSCERRSEYIVAGPACVEAFLHCCKEMENKQPDEKEDNLKLARSNDEESFMDTNEVVSRTNFDESWLWLQFTLPPCDDRSPNCQTTQYIKNVPLQDSITTWEFTGISLSRTHGICVGEPLEVIVRKDFFIDLRLPYAAVRGEQIEVKAILHNHSPDPITVRVDLMEAVDVCSVASKRGMHRLKVEVAEETTQAVPFIIIPMKEGNVNIEVKAVVMDSTLNDGIIKTLRVVSQGVLVKSSQIVSLNPAVYGKDGQQVETINSGIPRSDLVPNSHPKTVISLAGREELGDLVEKAISGESMGTLIYQPSGCGEQNMIHMTLPVIATIYLDKTNQWEAVGIDKRNEALQHIETGYKNELVFRNPDGSFAVWKNRDGSSWLTAYVAKVFAMAENLVAVDKDVICNAIKYLILNAQQPDGMFAEVGKVSHGEMIGDVRGLDSDASMTAFNLISMQETRGLCAATVNSLPSSIDKAVSYLEKRLPSLTNPYAVAMTSYALANENKLNREILFKFVSPELSHWPVPRGHKYTLEATAYALLALVKANALEDARPVVRWFTQQQFVGGGYGSTQSTIMVYQAVSEYWAAANEPEYNLDVEIQIAGRSNPVKYSVSRENYFATRTSKFNDINQDVKVTARGTGEATVKMVSLYYALPREKESDCQRFNMTVDLIPATMEEDNKTFMLTIKVLYNSKEHDSTMAVLDIGLLTGFTVDEKDLESLSTGHARTIAKFEMNKLLSEKGSLIIYLDKVSHKVPEEISFKIHRDLKVGVIQPATVSVYEYYNQTHCVKFYHPERRAGHLLQLCRDLECTCAEENCSMQKKGKIRNEDRYTKLCESTPASTIEFAYKVLLENVSEDLSTDSYSMRIMDVIKEGGKDIGALDSLRTFLGYQYCRESLGLKKGHTYLIMGSSKDVHHDVKGKTYQYVLGERTWIEYWPTLNECKSNDGYRETCLGIQKMIHQFRTFPCQQ